MRKYPQTSNQQRFLAAHVARYDSLGEEPWCAIKSAPHLIERYGIRGADEANKENQPAKLTPPARTRQPLSDRPINPFIFRLAPGRSPGLLPVSTSAGSDIGKKMDRMYDSGDSADERPRKRARASRKEEQEKRFAQIRRRPGKR